MGILDTLKYKTTKANIAELLLLRSYAQSMNPIMAINLLARRAIIEEDNREARFQVEKKIAMELMELDEEGFEAAVMSCVGNIQQFDGKYLYPDGTNNDTPYQERNTPAAVAPADPTLNANLNKMWGAGS